MLGLLVRLFSASESSEVGLELEDKFKAVPAALRTLLAEVTAVGTEGKVGRETGKEVGGLRLKAAASEAG